MEPESTCSPNTYGINTAMFGSAATLARNSRLLPGLLGHWVGKSGWLVGHLVRCLFAWLVGRMVSYWFVGGSVLWVVVLLACCLVAWLVCCVAGPLVGGLVGYVVRR